MKHLTNFANNLYCLQNQLVIILFSLILISGSVTPAVFAQSPEASTGAGASGGVNVDGSWYVGENLKVGDFFKYKLCHQMYKDCTDFWISFWVEKEITVPEDLWRFQVLIEDGNKVVKGYMNIGKVAPEPTGGSDNIVSYGAIYKSSISWLSGFVTAEINQPGKGPKDFRLPSWGKIANIGGEQVSPIGMETITVPAGQYDTILIGWKAGVITSHISVVDEFPLPVKASTWVQVTEGTSPQEYRFSLYEYSENVSSNPFTGFIDTEQTKKDSGCITEYDFVKVRENTNTNSLTLNIFYGPEKPRIGCDIEWILEFKKIYSGDLWQDQVHYDIRKVDVVDGRTIPIASAADDEGRDKFYSASGQVHRYWLMQGDSGLQKFAVMVWGTGPEYQVPNTESFGWVTFDIQLQPAKSASGQIATTPEASIPGWIKNNAGWWADGVIDDNSFVSGIQWLISNEIVNVPPTEQGIGGGASVIPDWIKNNAGWWANGQIPDSAFVSGLQWLISNGIMTVS